MCFRRWGLSGLEALGAALALVLTAIQSKLRSLEDRSSSEINRCTHPPEYRRRRGNQHAGWVRCMKCGQRISYTAGAREQWRQGKPEEVTITETYEKVQCRMCRRRIPCGTRAALSGASWRHLECLENEPATASGSTRAGANDVKGWRMPPGSSGWCQICQEPLLADQMVTQGKDSGSTGAVHMKCWLKAEGSLPAQQAARGAN